jgi:hypothetical protein
MERQQSLAAGWLSGKESVCKCRRHRFDFWVEKILWNREQQRTPVFLPGKFHRQRSPEGYSPWGHKQLDMTERLRLSLSLLILWDNVDQV